MAKNSSNLYCAIDTDENILPVRGPDDPPPYYEVDPSVGAPVPSAGWVTAPPHVHAPSAPVTTTTSSGTSGALEYIATKRNRLLRNSRGHSSSNRNRTHPAPSSPTSDSSEPAVLTRGVALASKSIDVVCPHCKADIRTSIEKRPGLLAYLSGAVMACLCCFCGCCLIPCCIDECMEVKHTCPNCDGLIGKYRL